jgi:predicted Zn-dependent protease
MHVVRKAGYAPAPRATRAWKAKGLADLAWTILDRNPQAAGEIADAALRLDPGCILGLRAKVRAKVVLEDTDGLEDLARALLHAAPDQFWGALAMGACHILRGKTPQAAPWLDKAEADTDTGTLMTVASLWLAGGRPANAERVFRTVLTRDPENVSAEIGVALAAVARRDFTVAELALDRALRQDPGRPAIHLQLARVYAKTGRTSDASRAAAMAARLGASRSQAEAARKGLAAL